MADTEAQRQLAEDVNDIAVGINTVRDGIAVVRVPLRVVKTQFKSIDTLEKSIESAQKKLKSAEKIFNTLEKIGALKAFARPVKKVIDSLEGKISSAHKKLEVIDEKTDKFAKTIETIDRQLSSASKVLKVEAYTVKQFAEHLAVTNQKLDSSRGLLTQEISGLSLDAANSLKARLPDMLARVDQQSLLASTSLQLILGKFDGLNAAFATMNGYLNDPVFDKMDAFQAALHSVVNVLATAFGPLQKVYDAAGPVLDALGSIFGFLLAPLEFILDKIIEATGVKALMDKLADTLADELLPQFDLGILQEIETKLDEIFDVNFLDHFTNNIQAVIDSILGDINAPNVPTALNVPTEGDDVLQGSFTDVGATNINALGGDDVVSGTEFNDTLDGGAGGDFLIGGGGDDTLCGGDNPADRPDAAIFVGSIDDYGIVSYRLTQAEIDAGVAGSHDGCEVTPADYIWRIVDYRSDAQIAASTDHTNNGTDTLFNVELAIFDDYVLDLTAGSFIRTQSADGEFAYVTPTSSNLPDVGGIPIRTRDEAGDLGRDRIYGALGLDSLVTGDGNDQLHSGANGPLTQTNFLGGGDLLKGGPGNDIYFIDGNSGTTDVIFDAGGNDSVDYSQYVNFNTLHPTLGLTIFLGLEERELFYRPTSIAVNADPVGIFDPFGNVFQAQVFGIENLDGTRYDDHFYGSDAVNILKGGAGNDEIRGLDGDDTLLGGDGHDTLIGDGGNDFLDGGAGANVYIGSLGDDTISDESSSFSTVKYAAYAQTAKYNQNIDFTDFNTTGFGIYTTDNLPGSVVILASTEPGIQQVSKYAGTIVDGLRVGVDHLEGIERIVGTQGRDIIYAAEGVGQTIYGNGGNDELFSSQQASENRFYAGPGDDKFVGSSRSEDTFFGGEGSDTIVVGRNETLEGDLYFGDDNRSGTPLAGVDVFDLSLSEFSWHIYLNVGSGTGTVVGKAPLDRNLSDDERFIQPTININGVVPKQPGVSIPGETYPGVPQELRVADPNTDSPGGEMNNFGEFEWIYGSNNRDIITIGSPDGAMRVDGLGGDDVLFAGQTANNTVHGGDGNDVIGTFNHTYSTDPNSSFHSTSITIVLAAGAGDDTLVAGDAQEYFSGGEGLDLLTYETSRAAVSVNLLAGTVSDGYANGDILGGGIENLTGSQFDDTLAGDDGHNEIVGWHGNDLILGFGDGDALYGNDGDDTIEGGAGNDLLHGGNGADLIDGGEGTDTASWNQFQVDPKGDLERITGDTSSLTIDLVTGMAGPDLLISIENIKAGVGDDTVRGDSGDNVLAGNLGDDSLDGREGKDILIGGLGNDTLIGGAHEDFLTGGAGFNLIDGGQGKDTLDYGVLKYGVTIEMAGVGGRTGLLTGIAHSLTPVDHFVWSDSLTTMMGPTGLVDDIIETGTNEVRYTYQTLDRGTDDPSDDGFIQQAAITPERIWYLDPFFARNFNDLDPVPYLHSGGQVLAQEVTRIDIFENARDEFKSIEVIAGGQGADSILGNGENTLFHGGLGADTIDAGDGVDTASFTGSEAGVTINLDTGSASGGEAEGDVLSNFENIIGTTFADHLTGNAEDNIFTLSGGDDTAFGGDGTDKVILPFNSTTAIVQKIGNDLRIVEFDGLNVLSTITVGADVEFIEFMDQTMSFGQAEDLVISGSNLDDLIIGTPVFDPLNGYAGNDVIEGRAGNDTIDGGDDDDLLKGEEGDDSLIGGLGHDQFVGGLGNDTFVVSASDEIIQENANEGFDVVITGSDFVLPENVEGGFGAVLTDHAVGVVGQDVGFQITGNALDNLLQGGSNDVVLVGGDGNDTLTAGEGTDTLIGGSGNDIYHVKGNGTQVVEAANGGFDVIVTTADILGVPTNVEAVVVDGASSVRIEGGAGDQSFTDGKNSFFGGSDTIEGSGNSTFDGGDGRDILILAYDFASTSFSMNADGFIVLQNGAQTDFAKNIELFDFGDRPATFAEIFEEIYPKQNVQLFAGDRYDTDFPIDMTPEGGGTQFLNIGPRNSGDNDGNRIYFETAFETSGKGFFHGTGLLTPETGTITRIAVDFSGGNTTQMSIDGFSKPFPEISTADWLYFQLAIFGGDDRVVGSYYDDKLVGYRGDDTIFGGLGDKEGYNVEGSPPSVKPSTLRDAGDIVSDPAFFVDDGDDLIDGKEGDDQIDGGTGADTLLGGQGDDQLFGGGGIYADSLDGGAGNDTLTGGEGGDLISLATLIGHDVMTDFELGVDHLLTTGLSAVELAAMTFSNDGINTVITVTADNTLTLENTILTGLPVEVIDLSGSFNGFLFGTGEIFDASFVTNNISVSALGDLNGDGLDDFGLSRGSGAFPPSFQTETTIYLSNGGMPATTTVKVLSDIGERGAVIASAGDFNDDGFGDFLIANGTNTHLVFGTAGGAPSVLDLTLIDGTNGFSMAASGSGFRGNADGGFDFNGDGIDDIVVGAAYANGSGGEAYVVFGTAAPMDPTLDLTALDGTNGIKLVGPSGYNLTGDSVSAAGDINGDGFDDLAVGVPYLYAEDPLAPGSTNSVGGAYVVYGSDAGFGASIDLSTISAAQGTEVTGVFETGQDRTGREVSGGGDVNGDGYDDFLIGVGRATSPAIPDQPDRAYLVYGQAGGLGSDFSLEDLDGNNGTTFSLDFEGPNFNAMGIVSADIVGDVNNDRIADFVISVATIAEFDPPNPITRFDGNKDIKTFVIYGKEGGFGAEFDLNTLSFSDGFLVTAPDGSGFGGDVTAAGDVNGDGGADILLGSTKGQSAVLYGQAFSNLAVTGDVLILGIAAEDETLTADASGLVDRDGTGALMHQWLRDGVDIPGANNHNYVLGDVDIGASISVRVSFVDGFGTTEMVTSGGTAMVSNINDDPIAADDTADIKEDATIKINVLANDTDDDQDLLTITNVGPATSGSTLANADGTITYTPNAEFSGADSFTYTVSDGQGGTSSATVNVTVEEVNDRPVAVDDAVTIVENGFVVIDLLGNDSDIDSANLSVTAIGPREFGGVLNNGNGTITYYHSAEYGGVDTFSYTVTDDGGASSIGTVRITITDENDAPNAVDDAIVVVQGLARTFDPHANDEDIDNTAPNGSDTFSTVSATDGQFGTTVVNVDGTITYTPITEYNGFDAFTYTIEDQDGAADTAAVQVFIERNERAIANNVTLTLDEDTSISYSPLDYVTDLEGDVVTLASFGSVFSGSVVETSPGTLLYTPVTDGHGMNYELIEYTVVDIQGRESTGLVRFNVNPVNDPTLGALEITGDSESFSLLTVRENNIGDADGLVDAAQTYVWRRDGVVVQSSIKDWYFTTFEDEGHQITVETSFTDLLGNTTVVTSQPTPTLVPAPPAFFEPGVRDQVDIFLGDPLTRPDLSADLSGPLKIILGPFEVGTDTGTGDKVDLSNLGRLDVLNAIDTAELGSAILTFDNGNVLVIEGDGVTPSALTLDHFIIGGANFDVTGAVEISGEAREGQTLTSDVSSVVDLDGIDASTIRYQWQRGAQDIAGATAANYTLVAADAGEVVRLVYSFSDRFGVESTLNSAATTEIVPLVIPGETIFGDEGANDLEGTIGNDAIYGGGGDDTLTGGQGDDRLLGFGDTDTAVFNGDQSAYTIRLGRLETTITHRVAGQDGTDVLDSIELLDFETEIPLFGGNPMNLDIFDGPAQLGEADFAALTELYIAYFNRAPDALGLYYWGSELARGVPLLDIAGSFFIQPETRATYPDLSDVGNFVNAVYNNVLGRSSDQLGFDYWVGELENNPNITQAGFILAIINGAKSETGSAADAEYLASKADLGAYFAVIRGMSDIGNARDVMAIYDGSAESIDAAVSSINAYYQNALDPVNGEFLFQLVGVLDDPFVA